METEALAIMQAAIDAVKPENFMPRWLTREGDLLRINETVYRLSSGSRLLLAGAGKASAAMAKSALEILGNRVSAGVLVTKYGHRLALPAVRCLEAGHPLSDDQSMAAGTAVLELLSGLQEKDLVLFLTSGGASALLADLPPAVSLSEYRQVSDFMLRSGADIREMNTVRKHLSPGIKGGRLSRAAYPATVVNLILSDVVGDPLDIIASGPTVPDPSSFRDAWEVLEKYQLINRLPDSIGSWLRDGLAGRVPETPKPGDPLFARTHNLLVASNKMALEAAQQEARRRGFHSTIVTDAMEGEAREQARNFVQRILQYAGPRPACLLMGGETTVKVQGNGLGGRNQEFVLAAFEMLSGNATGFREWPLVLSVGTDGGDGPTDAAGALLGRQTAEAARDLGLSPADYLRRNDSYHFFEKTGGLIKTGPTQTNVMDLVLAILP